MQSPWETELAGFLTELSEVQDQSLELLTRKRDMLVAGDGEGLAALASEEEQVIERLRACLRKRQELLERADDEGLPSANLRALSSELSGGRRGELPDRVQQATARARLLRHHSLTNWVLVQRTLLHLSQMLEIIATGGKLRPTYGRGESTDLCGALVDRAA